MNKKNIKFVEGLALQFSNAKIKYRFIDARWKKRGDVDLIVAKDSIKKF